VKTKFHSTG